MRHVRVFGVIAPDVEILAVDHGAEAVLGDLSVKLSVAGS
jgi:hypothetical protein